MFSNYKEVGAPLMTDSNRKERATFTISPSHFTLANSIVRVIQSKIPTVGFRTEPPEESEVEILTNTTPLPNEMLTHRIGMIPIAIFGVDEFEAKRYRVELNVENATQEPRSVTTRDFQVLMEDSEGWKPIDSSQWFPADSITKDHILITVLRPQWSADSMEKISLKANPSVGTAEENVRFSPVCTCSYGLTIDTDAVRQEQFFNDWLRDSKKINDASQINPTQLSALRREWMTLEIQRCYLINEKDQPYSFDFSIETNGIFSVPEVFHQGIRQLKKLIQRYEGLDVAIPDGVVIQPTLGARRGVEVLFTNGEDHTLGNLLQTFLVERHIQEDISPRISYASYKISHPLKKELVVEIGAEKDAEIVARKAIVAVVRYILGVLDQMEREWLAFTGTAQPLPTLESVVVPKIRKSR
jgi:DNA-directed RNA polymerase subunit L